MLHIHLLVHMYASSSAPMEASSCLAATFEAMTSSWMCEDLLLRRNNNEARDRTGVDDEMLTPGVGDMVADRAVANRVSLTQACSRLQGRAREVEASII